MDKQQRGTVSRNTIIKPEERYKEIIKIVRNNQFDRDPYLKELNIRVHDREMLEIKGILTFFLIQLYSFTSSTCIDTSGYQISSSRSR